MYANGNAARNTLAMVLAGGKGERLSPLTLNRPKTGCPFWREVQNHRLCAQ